LLFVKSNSFDRIETPSPDKRLPERALPLPFNQSRERVDFDFGDDDSDTERTEEISTPIGDVGPPSLLRMESPMVQIVPQITNPIDIHEKILSHFLLSDAQAQILLTYLVKNNITILLTVVFASIAESVLFVLTTSSEFWFRRVLLFSILFIPMFSIWASLNQAILWQLMTRLTAYWMTFHLVACAILDASAKMNYLNGTISVLSRFLLLPLFALTDALPEEIRARYCIVAYSLLICTSMTQMLVLILDLRKDDRTFHIGPQTYDGRSLRLSLHLTLIAFSLRFLVKILRRRNSYIIWDARIRVDESVVAKGSFSPYRS